MKSFRFAVAASLLLVAGCASKNIKVGPDGQVQSSQEGIPLVGTTKVERHVLDNGLRLLIVEDHSSPTFAYETWFRVGSRDEVPGRTGLAHLFEHMMFKGTKTLKDGEFDKILEAAGAEGENAFTSRDYTAYVQEMPSTQLETIMRLEADRMVNLIVDEKAFKTETEVVQNERRFRNENSPDGTMYQELFSTAFTKHPYRWPVIGYQKDLESMTSKDAEAFYRAYYSPNHATVVVVGDVDPSKVLSLAKKYYGPLPRAASPVHILESEPPQTAARRKVLRLSIQVEKLLIGYHIPGLTHEDMPALDVLDAVMSGGKSSRLSRALVDTGIANSVGSYGIDDKDPSLMVVAANLQRGKKAAQAEAIILSEIARLAKEPISDLELERARNRLNFNFYEGLGSNNEKARFLGHFEAIANDFQAGIAFQKKIQSVTALDVQAAARRYLDAKNRTVITGVQK